jgi:hypothetical protein
MGAGGVANFRFALCNSQFAIRAASGCRPRAAGDCKLQIWNCKLQIEYEQEYDGCMSRDSATSNNQPRAGVFKRCVVYLFAALAIAALATISFAGATLYDNSLSIGMDGGPAMVPYSYGWPWCYCQRECLVTDRWIAKRVAVWLEPSEWRSWALIGDGLVFAVGGTIVVLLARRAMRRITWRFTLAGVMVMISVTCVVLGYVSKHRRLRIQEKLLLQEENAWLASLSAAYCGPRWLLQLVGNGRWLDSFHHYTEVDVSQRTISCLVTHARDLHYVQRVKFNFLSDAQVREFLQSREEWRIEEIKFWGQGGAGLSEIHRCPRLRALDAWFTPIGDDAAIEIGAHCPRLEMLQAFNISDAGLQGLSKCRRLRSLWVRGPGITDAGVAALANCQQLEDLVLRDTELTPASVETFRSLPLLRKLLIDVPPERVEALDKALQDLGIEELTVISLK